MWGWWDPALVSPAARSCLGISPSLGWCPPTPPTPAAVALVRERPLLVVAGPPLPGPMATRAEPFPPDPPPSWDQYVASPRVGAVPPLEAAPGEASSDPTGGGRRGASARHERVCSGCAHVGAGQRRPVRRESLAVGRSEALRCRARVALSPREGVPWGCRGERVPVGAVGAAGPPPCRRACGGETPCRTPAADSRLGFWRGPLAVAPRPSSPACRLPGGVARLRARRPCAAASSLVLSSLCPSVRPFHLSAPSVRPSPGAAPRCVSLPGPAAARLRVCRRRPPARGRRRVRARARRPPPPRPAQPRSPECESGPGWPSWTGRRRRAAPGGAGPRHGPEPLSARARARVGRLRCDRPVARPRLPGPPTGPRWGRVRPRPSAPAAVRCLRPRSRGPWRSAPPRRGGVAGGLRGRLRPPPPPLAPAPAASLASRAPRVRHGRSRSRRAAPRRAPTPPRGVRVCACARARAVSPTSPAYLVDPASSICLSQRLSHACLSTHGRYSETANGSLNQLWFLWSLAPLLLG